LYSLEPQSSITAHLGDAVTVHGTLNEPVSRLELKPEVYPPWQTLYLPAIKEKVPVYERTFRISQDVRVDSSFRILGLAAQER
jgi:hypothetical protein